MANVFNNQGTISVDYDGIFWGCISSLYKYKYLTKEGKTRRSGWVNLKPRDFIIQHDCSIIDYQMKEKRG